jgi:hypothetical protein
MRRVDRPLRLLAGAAAVLVGVAVLWTAGPASADGPIVNQSFAADSGDNCRSGYTNGNFAWHVGRGPLAAHAVDVSGILADRPLPTDPNAACRDPRFTSATFAAYNGNGAVDRERVTVDNGQITIEFRLGGDAGQTVVTRVVVQVCRHAHPWTTVPDYCGRPVEYRTPPSPWV